MSGRSQDATPTTSTPCARLPSRDRPSTISPRRPPARACRSHHDESSREAERDVDRPRARARRRLHEVGEENDTWVVVFTGAGRAFSSGLDLKDYGVIPNIDGLTWPHRGALDARLLALRPDDATHPPADHRRRSTAPRSVVACASAWRGSAAGVDRRRLQRHRHRQRPDQHRDGLGLAAAAPDRRRERNDLLLTGRRSTPTRRCAWASSPASSPMARSPTGARRRRRHVPVQSVRLVDDEERALGVARDRQPRDRHRVRGSQRAAPGFTENLQEAIRAFDEGASPSSPTSRAATSSTHARDRPVGEARGVRPHRDDRPRG